MGSSLQAAIIIINSFLGPSFQTLLFCQFSPDRETFLASFLSVEVQEEWRAAAIGCLPGADAVPSTAHTLPPPSS